MSVCETETCRLHSAVLALGSVLALSGAVNLFLAAYIAYKARMCRSWCVRRNACSTAHASHARLALIRSGKTRSAYAARQASCPLRCTRCRRPYDVPFRWSWHACAWVHAAEQGPVLARASVSVFGFPVSSTSAAAFHLTAVVAALDAPDAPPAQARAHEAMQLGPARPQAMEVDGDVETGSELDFYGQETRHSTADFFTPGAPVMLNPFFRSAA